MGLPLCHLHLDELSGLVLGVFGYFFPFPYMIPGYLAQCCWLCLKREASLRQTAYLCEIYLDKIDADGE